jgi:hypothetical protein
MPSNDRIGNAVLYWWVLIRCCGHLFTTPLPSNDCLYSSHYSGFQPSCHIAPSLKLLILNSLQITISSPRECACDVCDRPCELNLNVVLAPMVLLLVCGHRTFKIGWCFYSASILTIGNLFFCLGGGQLLHSVLSLVVQSLRRDPTASCTTSSLRGSSVFLPPRSSCCFTLSTNALPYECSPCVVQEKQDGLTVRWQTPAGAHQWVGSSFSAECGMMRPGAGPQISPQVLQ